MEQDRENLFLEENTPQKRQNRELCKKKKGTQDKTEEPKEDRRNARK